MIDPRLLDRGFTPEQLEILKQRAHDTINSNVTTSLNVRIAGDLNRFSYDMFDYIVTLYSIYDKTGSLPYPGSVSEQPAKVIELFNIIEQLQMERRQQEAAKRQREMKKNG